MSSYRTEHADGIATVINDQGRVIGRYCNVGAAEDELWQAKFDQKRPDATYRSRDEAYNAIIRNAEANPDFSL